MSVQLGEPDEYDPALPVAFATYRTDEPFRVHGITFHHVVDEKFAAEGWSEMALYSQERVHEESLRADAAEREVARLRRIQARLLSMASVWPTSFPNGIRSDMAADTITTTIKEATG